MDLNFHKILFGLRKQILAQDLAQWMLIPFLFKTAYINMQQLM